MLSWFFFLNFFNKKTKKISFAILPKSSKKFTHTRAPMAHKTFSKEQFMYKFFTFKIVFNNFFPDVRYLNINTILYLILLAKQNFYSFETNLAFLKNFTIFYYFNELTFFNYHFFLNK